MNIASKQNKHGTQDAHQKLDRQLYWKLMTSSAACLQQLACGLAMHTHLPILLTRPAAAAAVVVPLTDDHV